MGEVANPTTFPFASSPPPSNLPHNSVLSPTSPSHIAPVCLNLPHFPSAACSNNLSSLSAHASPFVPQKSGPANAPRFDSVSSTVPLDDVPDPLDLDDVDAALLENFLSSDTVAAAPPPCECHALPIGSCPKVKKNYLEISLQLQSLPGKPANMDSLRIPLPRQSFPIPTWRFALQHYFDGPEIVSFLEFGWDFSFLSPPSPKDAHKNLASAKLAPHDVDTYIATELTHGALIGPFEAGEIPFPVFRSPIGTVHKVPVRRTITDCSQLGAGINSYISAHLHRGKTWKLSLPTTKTIVALIQKCKSLYPGERLQMFKLDFSRWYRWFGIDLGQAPFFAIGWNHKTFLDSSMSFGNRAAALCAQRTMYAIVWLFRTQVEPAPGVQNSGFNCCCPTHCDCGDNCPTGYIDDSIVICPESLASYQFEAFIRLCQTLGLRISSSPGHVSPPAANCIALGLLYNLDDNTVSLPAPKLQALLDLIDEWLAKKRASEKQFASLAGKLLNAANVVRSGRLLTSRILANKRLAASVPVPVLVDEACRADLLWWREALLSRNGVSFLEPDHDLTLAMDASSHGWWGDLPGLAGFNFATSEYWHGPPPSEFESWDICDLETLCHVVSTHIWAPSWNYKQVLGQTDNMVSFYLFTNGRSRDNLRLEMARFVASAQVSHQFVWTPQWISTHRNVIPDALSRWGTQKYRDIFFAECARLNITPKKIELRPEYFNFKYHLGSSSRPH